MKLSKIKFKNILLFFAALLIIVEVTLRIVGIGNPVLYIEDKDFEYIYAPNQRVKRFGNWIETNEYSMRSKPINKKDSIVVLVIGDSVLNGGTQIDQDSLSTSILEHELTTKYKQTIRILNLSAGSWGPDNAMAFIKKHGNFNSFLIVFVFSSHDYYDVMYHEKVVGLNKSYPAKKPLFAIQELVDRYIFTSNGENRSKKVDGDLINTSKIENSGWNNINLYCKENNISLLGYVHPTKRELLNKKYFSSGIKLINKLSYDSVQFIQGINYMSVDGYRDKIHINEKGNRILAKTLQPLISKKINERFHLKTI